MPAAGIGALINHADEVVIEHSLFGYTNAGSATDGVKLCDVKNAKIERCSFKELANRITTDAQCGTLEVIESEYATLTSAAARTFVTKDGTRAKL